MHNDLLTCLTPIIYNRVHNSCFRGEMPINEINLINKIENTPAVMATLCADVVQVETSI